jgi:hypothetical protein
MSRHRPASFPNVRRRTRFVTPLVAAILLIAAFVGSGSARADAFLPPPHQIFAGVTDKSVSAYVAAAGKHPAVYQEFAAWGQYLPGITADASAARARMMMAITTAFGSREAITPGGIARGRGDAWLIGLNRAIYDSHNITYIRLMAEMDGYWNPFSAFDQNGSRRDSAHSTASYKKAWKRVTLILRGGGLSHINAVLRRLHMPKLHASRDLPRPEVAMLWVPEAPPGDPAVPGNQPRNYYPGNGWVDWVGTDFYSKFKNFSGITKLYNQYPGKPFVFGEYALWESGDDVSFVERLFGWAASHARTQMMIYNQGINPTGPFRLLHYPNASRALRAQLASPRFPAFAPEWAG